MGAIATVLFLGGVIALFYGIWNKLKARRVAGVAPATTGDASQNKGAGAKGAIAVEGKVACAEPLISPMTGTPCLYFRLTVEEAYTENGEDKTKEIQDAKSAALFTIDDGSGAVRIDANKGGDFEPLQSKKETKSMGLVGGLKGKDLVFGNFTLPSSLVSMSSKYTVREEVLPVTPSLYVLGKLEGGAIAAPGFRSMVITNKSRAELLASAGTNAKRFMIGGAVALAVSIILNIVIVKTEKPTAATSSSAKQTSSLPSKGR